MTIEEAIKFGKRVLSLSLFDETHEFCEIAIKALEQEPKLWQALEQEKGAYNALVKDLQCSDCISRQAAIDACLNGWNKDYKEIVKEIRALPPVIPAEKVGRWKRISMDKYSEHAKYWYRCDRCGEDNLGNTNYCPHCGAKMQEVEE